MELDLELIFTHKESGIERLRAQCECNVDSALA